MFDSVETWASDFVLTRDAAEIGAKSALYANVATGEMVLVAPGVYFRRDIAARKDCDLSLARMRGEQLAARHPVVSSHMSAARLWDLPVHGNWPAAVHAQHARSWGVHPRPGLVLHENADLGFAEWRDGLRVTSLARAVADVVSVIPLAAAVIVMDAALSGKRLRILPVETRDVRRNA
jgi:hypothetical protein